MLKYIVQNWLDYHYWLSMNPVSWSRPWLMGLLIAFGVILVASVVAGVMATAVKKRGDHLTAQAWRQGRNLGTGLVIMGMFLVWFRYEGVTLLSSRWWWVLLVVWAVWRIVFLTLFVFKKLPQYRAALEKKKAFEKYLP